MGRDLQRAARRIGIAIGFLAALLPAPLHAADPLLMFLLGFARNLIASAIEAHRAQPSAPMTVPPPAPAAKAPGSLDSSDLRALIDESFLHLSVAQRAELLAGLDMALSDPANEPHREAILTQFVGLARQIRFTHAQLDRLSAEQKRAVAQQFASNFRTLEPVQQQALLEQLSQRALPLPADLNDMMLAALGPSR